MVTKKKPATKAKKATPAAKSKVKAKAAPKKAAPKKAPAAKKLVAKKAAPKKAPAAKKLVAKKAAPKKAPAAKKSIAKKAAPKKAPITKKPKAKNPAIKKSISSAKTKPKNPNAHFEVSEFTPYKIKRGEGYMNESQHDHFKNILLNWRNELMEEVDRTVHHMQDEAASPPDPADRATLEEEFSIELRTRDRERRLIKKIHSTIELIAKDDYGFCDSCGVEIGIRRLEARPTANKCIDCKTLDEIKEKQLGA